MSISHYLIHPLMDTEVTLEYKPCTYTFDTGTTLSVKPISDMSDRDQQKSFAFYMGMFPDPHNWQKQSTLCCLAYLHLCYSILTQIHAVLYMQSKKTVSSEIVE